MSLEWFEGLFTLVEFRSPLGSITCSMRSSPLQLVSQLKDTTKTANKKSCRRSVLTIAKISYVKHHHCFHQRRSITLNLVSISTKIMSAAGMGAASTSSAIYEFSRTSDRTRRSSLAAQGRRRSSSTPHLHHGIGGGTGQPAIRKENTPHFYIPGEVSTGGHFPGQKEHEEEKKKQGKLRNYLANNKLWILLQSTLKKGELLSPKCVMENSLLIDS